MVEYADNLAINNMMLQTSNNKGEESENNIKKGIGIQLKCDLCGGPISGKTRVLKFANFERFFCCAECRSAYKKKYSGRIDALMKRYEELI
ncbi:MAG: TRASH domain-containing protein [Thermoproteota archaeon]|nr:TRASH domain-containing protein [Thermoproteota archaeon]